MVAPGVETPTLAAFIDYFCAQDFEVRPEAGGLSRTAQIEHGVFFTLEAPFLRIIALYSNALEDPGVIASPEIGDSQLKFLEAALARVKKENFDGALVFAHHHPAFTLGSTHGWSGRRPAGVRRALEPGDRMAAVPADEVRDFHPVAYPGEALEVVRVGRQHRVRPHARVRADLVHLSQRVDAPCPRGRRRRASRFM
jgi:hypothetical protein